jgi:hypothetical protein
MSIKTTKSYAKQPKYDSVFVPGFGLLSGAQIIEGEYDRFVPSILMVVPDVPKKEPAPPKTRAKKVHVEAAPVKEDVKELVKEILEVAHWEAPAPVPSPTFDASPLLAPLDPLQDPVHVEIPPIREGIDSTESPKAGGRRPKRVI